MYNLLFENIDYRVVKGNYILIFEKNDIVFLNFKIKKESLEKEGNI